MKWIIIIDDCTIIVQFEWMAIAAQLPIVIAIGLYWL
jgi:hypothetical protein